MTKLLILEIALSVILISCSASGGEHNIEEARPMEITTFEVDRVPYEIDSLTANIESSLSTKKKMIRVVIHFSSSYESSEGRVSLWIDTPFKEGKYDFTGEDPEKNPGVTFNIEDGFDNQYYMNLENCQGQDDYLEISNLYFNRQTFDLKYSVMLCNYEQSATHKAVGEFKNIKYID